MPNAHPKVGKKPWNCSHEHRPHVARGFCDNCYGYWYKQLTKEEFDLKFPRVPLNYTADYYEEQRGYGFTIEQIADDLGITVRSVEQAVLRKKKRQQGK